ncbi:peptide ABC transporter [Corynebacterium yudongzhengii]|uniref:Peptide ABC transporter n=1 Tax=Corynebacterium yudongzhengii TaxID=2080740 RepID=A0A2U1T471_9CORY|nr:peptide ABC transporter [Corynebacterium yudongzhengii]PWC00797.1 peptide ABC transporter [Corynebacterium yudongzhengii]
MAACGEEGPPPEPATTEYFGYQVDKPLLTSNAASLEGVSTNAEALSARLYPAAFVSGPSGQSIPNSDLLLARSVHGPSFSVEYQINEDATFSDGDPVDCVDFQLAHTAGTTPELFDAHLPLMKQVEQFQCAEGSKRFRIVFREGDGGRWRELFDAGSVLPAHTIAREAGLEPGQMHAAVNGEDEQALAAVAEVWNTGFDLAEFNPQLQVSFGPYMIDRVGAEGEVVLARNPHYSGDDAVLEHIVVWPREADSERLRAEGALRIADTPTAEPGFDTTGYAVESVVGELTDSLRISDEGLFADRDNRQAFAACIDRKAVARASSEASGVEVPPVAVHTVPHLDPIRAQLEEIDSAHAEPDYEAAEPLRGQTVRIGYLGPDERKAAMVEAIGASCAEAGITVEDASADGSTLADLEGGIDAYLWGTHPMREYGTVSARLTEVDNLRKAEEAMWEELPSIPLSAQPRTFAIDEDASNVVVYSGLTGIGWNKDRWQLTEDEESSAEESEDEVQ